ncbi:MAG: hypothetical protein M3094_11825, partial [Actinomycetia bacterium]|nr:hypothetical protein [Actinomycetes bacterium]
TDAEELDSEISDTADRVDDADARARAIQRRLGIDPKPESRTQRFRVVREVPPAETWEEVARRSRAELGDIPVNVDDLLTREEISSIERRFGDGFTARSRLDRYDIMAAVAAGVTAALLDYLVVAVPRDSGVTQALKKLSVDADNWLAGIAKVPYDRMAGVALEGIGPNAHRVMTFGHDPLLGWVYGTMDILRGSISGTSAGGVVKVLDQGLPVTDSLPVALALQAMHLISDVATPAGLPLPGWTALLSIDKTLMGSNETVAQIGRGMYIGGYDTWHLPTMAVPILGIEAVLRGYLGLRQLVDEEYREELDIERLQIGSDRVADLPRYEVMALIARGIAVAGNAGKFVLLDRNPLALNFPLWMAFAKSFIGRLDRAKPASAMVDTANLNRLILDAGWVSLEIDRDDLPEIRL